MTDTHPELYQNPFFKQRGVGSIADAERYSQERQTAWETILPELIKRLANEGITGLKFTLVGSVAKRTAQETSDIDVLVSTGNTQALSPELVMGRVRHYVQVLTAGRQTAALYLRDYGSRGSLQWIICDTSIFTGLEKIGRSSLRISPFFQAFNSVVVDNKRIGLTRAAF